MTAPRRPAPSAFEATVFEALLHGARTAPETALRWRFLEAAHVVGQCHFVPHVRTHWAMLVLALRTRDGREAVGQVARLLLTPLGHLSGRLPLGNPGRATVGAFQPMPVRADLAALIEQVRAAVA